MNEYAKTEDQHVPDSEARLEHGRRIQELLDALEDIDASEHEAALARLCSCEALRREVLALIAAEPAAAAYLDNLADDLLPKFRGSPANPSGGQIGIYRLVRELGRGGMGVVYEAERADGAFEQRVALKLLALSLASTEGRQRFIAERRILAGLEHPAITRILDGGVDKNETPWFAMEYVEGTAIDAYCDDRNLGIPERLALFLQICDAVEHAHRRLVIHRDLKPANVLVTEVAIGRDSAGQRQVKLLDFGIAKLINADGERTTHTELRFMTPEYASPEQVRGESVTTASDVYQLGLLLYELLTGHRPYSPRHRSAGELERAICEQPPTRPSVTLSRERGTNSQPVSGASLEAICRMRNSSPARLRRQLRGDIENIVLKALRKEPERRYGSADRLAQDIRRYLDGLPVMARPDTLFYRSRKFLQRHAFGAGAAAVIVLVAAATATFHTIRLQTERDRAQAEAAKAEQMSQFLAGLFRSADPRDAGGADLTARQLLDRGAEQVERNLTDQPEAQADMLHVLGRTYLEIGLHDSTAPLLNRALEIRRDQLGPNHPDVARTLGDIGLLNYQQGLYEQSRVTLEKAIPMLEASVGDDTAEIASMLSTLGRVHRSLGNHDESEKTLNRALEIQSRISGADSHAAATIMDNLGQLLVERGRPKDAEDLYARALSIHERELGANHIAVGRSLVDLANTRLYQGKLEGLDTMFRRGLAILEQGYGGDHASVGRALNNLGNVLTVSGRHHEAIEILQRALAVQSAALGTSHPQVAYPLASLGDAHFAQGDLPQAADYFQRSVTIRENTLNKRPFDPLLAHGLVRLGLIEVERGNPAAAEPILDRAVKAWRFAPGTTDPRLAPTTLDLGRWLVEQARCEEALPLLQRAHQLLAGHQPPPAAEIAQVDTLIGLCG